MAELAERGWASPLQREITSGQGVLVLVLLKIGAAEAQVDERLYVGKYFATRSAGRSAPSAGRQPRKDRHRRFTAQRSHAHHSSRQAGPGGLCDALCG
jgi:hypothetical protein